MVIKRARLYEVAIPLIVPFRISGGSIDTRRSLVVEFEDSEGNIGYGESALFEAPFYSHETTVSASSVIADILLPRMVNQPVSSSTELHGLLNDGIVGNQMARAGCETAWWDLHAIRENRPLTELITTRLKQLGVPKRWLKRSKTIECGIALGIPDRNDLTDLRRWVAAAAERGYRRIKLKVQPGWDDVPVTTTREVLEDEAVDLPITVDANGSYDLERDREALSRLDTLGLLYIEQPLPGDALWDLCTLSDELETPICLDETLHSDLIARQVIDMGGPDVWNIKIQRVGGLEEACRIYARAVSAGVRLWGGTMPETGLGALAMLALGCHAGFVFPSDIEPSERWYSPGADLIELEMAPDGMMEVREVREKVVSKNGWRLVEEVE